VLKVEGERARSFACTWNTTLSRGRCAGEGLVLFTKNFDNGKCSKTEGGGELGPTSGGGTSGGGEMTLNKGMERRVAPRGVGDLTIRKKSVMLQNVGGGRRRGVGKGLGSLTEKMTLS